MAELQFPNIVGGFLQGQQLGQQQQDRRQAQATRSRIGELASMAYGAAPEQRQQILGEAVGVDPEAGLALSRALGSEDDAREKRLLSTARLIASAPEQQKAAIFAQVRPQIAEYLPGLPETYNDQVGQGINAFIQSRSTGEGGDTVQSRFVGEDGQVYALLRSGAVKPLGIKADPNTQIIEGAGGFYGVDRRNLQATPVQVGAPAQIGSIGAVQPGTGFSIDPNVPPEVAAQIRQQESQAGGVPTSAATPESALAAGPQLQAPERQGAATWAPLSSDEIQGLGLPPGTVAQRNLQTGQVQTIRTPTAAQTTAAQGRPLPANIVTKLSSDSGKLANLGELQRSFQNDFAGSGFGGGAENLAGRLGLPGATPGQAEWWQQYDRYKNEVRNELFGASLTEGEQRAFEAADITPNMGPEVLRRNLAKQSEVIQKGLERQARTWGAQGYNREAIREATGVDVGAVRAGAGGDIPRPTTQAAFDALPVGAIYIDPDDGRQYRKQ